ncbi:MAG TPA: glutamyl-tRNA reductase [Candidatus Angelobacter sp.]|nr:glutamyl-tRNA reductase [Candidatus Angelobacter sp.]
MEPTLAVIGLNYRTSPVAVREQFWIAEPDRYEALHRLLRSEGIEEVIVLATCNRTEFILWANDVPAAANSVLRFLTQDYNLRLCDWSHFYRLMDDVAFAHLFQVAAGLDSVVLGEPEVSGQLRDAWLQAQSAGATGRFLDAVVHKALAVSARVRTETALGDFALTFPYAAVEVALGVLGDMAGREVLLMGAGRMSGMAAQCLRSAGANQLKVMNRTQFRGQELAQKLGGTAVSCDDRLALLQAADIVVCSTSCPHSIITLEDARSIAKARNYKPLVIIDIAVPRNVDHRVGEIDGVYLFNLDSLEEVIRRDTRDRRTPTEAANKIVAEEVQGFRRRLLAERVVPTIVALRQRLEDLCQQEVEFLREELGPFTEDQDQVLATLAAHITQRISGSLARELREIPDRTGQDMLTVAAHRLFSLESSDLAAEAGREN